MPTPEAELEELWAKVFGEPPSISARLDLLAEVLVKALPPAPPYQPGPLKQTLAGKAADAQPGEAVYRDRRAG